MGREARVKRSVPKSVKAPRTVHVWGQDEVRCLPNILKQLGSTLVKPKKEVEDAEGI